MRFHESSHGDAQEAKTHARFLPKQPRLCHSDPKVWKEAKLKEKLPW